MTHDPRLTPFADRTLELADGRLMGEAEGEEPDVRKLPHTHTPFAASVNQRVLFSMASSGNKSNAATQEGVTCADVGIKSEKKQKVRPAERAVTTAISRLCPGACLISIPGATSKSVSTNCIRPVSTSGS